MGEHNRSSPKAPAKSRPTIDDVAKLAGLSRTTVSFVVNGRKDMRISAEATERVQRAVKELGYRPNAVALALRNSETRIIAMISDSIATNEYAGQMVRGALESCQLHERLLVIAETNANPVLEREIVKGLIDRQVDGFIYATERTRTIQIPDVLSDVPCVLLNCVDELGVLSSFVPDDGLAGRLAAESLLNAGHRSDIYFVGMAMPDLLASSERIDGVTEALAASGTALAGVVSCSWWPEAAFESVSALLAQRNDVKAFICINDQVALGAYQALAEAGLRIPQDVSLVSFGDSLLVAWLRPCLTSVSIPLREIGAAAVNQLVRVVASEQRRVSLQPDVDLSVVTRLPTTLKERNSISPPWPR